MKKAELEVGKFYAYSTKQKVASEWHISKAEVVDLAPVGYRTENKVQVKFHDTRRNYATNEIEPFTRLEFVAPRYLVGEYDAVKNQIALDAKDKEIARLKSSIEDRRKEDLLVRYRKEFRDAGLLDYDYALRTTGDWQPFSWKLGEKQLSQLFSIIVDYNYEQRSKARALEIAEAQSLAEQETVNA